MSNYYDYRDVKVMIAHQLMKREGWKIYGYSPDNSDSMTDYWDPAYWGGVAEKNGYVLCVDVYGAEGKTEIRKYNHDGTGASFEITEKLKKLKELTTERGATEGEQAAAEKMIEKLEGKLTEKPLYIVEGYTPAHMENPPRCNWHIEKDGTIIAKGNGILKYKQIWNYYQYESDRKTRTEFAENREKWINDTKEDYIERGYYNSPEKAEEAAIRQAENLEKDLKLCEAFEQFINKLDTLCGGMIGDGELEQYKKVTVTKYKKELKAVETKAGEIKDGQCFILKSNFNYGCRKGLVYRIHERNGYYSAVKLNGKLTKECNGYASSNNHWSIGAADDSKFLGWINKGAISWCELQEVQTPYEVEKFVKEVIKPEKKAAPAADTKTAEKSEFDINKLTFTITEDVDTRDQSKIYIVKVTEKLSREEYIAVNKYIKTLGGYYSKFKHGFLFRNDPSDTLKPAV